MIYILPSTTTVQDINLHDSYTQDTGDLVVPWIFICTIIWHFWYNSWPSSGNYIIYVLQSFKQLQTIND